MKSDISVLPLEFWMRHYVDTAWGRAENDQVAMTPIFNRDGWYYNRRTKLEWYEYRGQAFITRSQKSFVYELAVLNAKILTTREVLAYKEVMNLRPPRDLAAKIKHILYWDKLIKQFRANALSIKRFRMKRGK